MACVLVAEDEQDIRAALVSELRAEGHKVVDYPNGEVVLGAAVEHRVDVVVLDLMMPVVDGFQALHALRAYPTTRDIPVIVVSAKGSPHERIRARAMGARDYINKPWSEGEVSRRVQLALSATATASKNGAPSAESVEDAPPEPTTEDPTVRVERPHTSQRPAVAAVQPGERGRAAAHPTPMIPCPKAGRFAVQVEASKPGGKLRPTPASTKSSFLLRPFEDPNWTVRLDTFDAASAAAPCLLWVIKKRSLSIVWHL